MPELPEIPALQHLAKARPKRPKKHAATRGVAKVTLFKDAEKSKINLIFVFDIIDEDDDMDITTV